MALKLVDKDGLIGVDVPLQLATAPAKHTFEPSPMLSMMHTGWSTLLRFTNKEGACLSNHLCWFGSYMGCLVVAYMYIYLRSVIDAWVEYSHGGTVHREGILKHFYFSVSNIWSS